MSRSWSWSCGRHLDRTDVKRLLALRPVHGVPTVLLNTLARRITRRTDPHVKQCCGKSDQDDG